MPGTKTILKKLEPHGSHLRSVGRLILLAGAVGTVAGIGAFAFTALCQVVMHYSLVILAGYHQGGPSGEAELFTVERIGKLVPWLLIIVPTVGGLVSGWLVYRFAPEAEGHGTDAAIDAYHNKRGVIRPRVPIIKMLSSAITLGTGGSGGREGPIAQIGAGFGSFLATRLGLNDSERRVLMAAGMGAGIGAIFHAPLAGAIFAIEVLYRDPDFEAEALIPSFISTIVAYCVFNFILSIFSGTGVIHDFTVFETLLSVQPGIMFNDPRILVPLTAMAVMMVFGSYLYVKCFYGVNRLFKQLKIPNALKPAIGAMLTGVVAVALYYMIGVFSYSSVDQLDSLSVLSFGYGYLQKILDPGEGTTLVIGVLLVVGIGKIITTSLTIGSGGSGGVFGPSMVIGGSLGAVVGLVFQKLMPGVVDRIDVFVLLGMASFFAAAANTPVSTLIMVSEMTGSYKLLLPSMWVCALAYLLSRGWSIYREQVPNRMESAAHRGDFIIDVLQGMTVKDAFDSSEKFTTVPLHMPLSQVVQMLTNTKQSCFAVLDRDEKYYGLFSVNDVRQFLYDSDIGELAVAQDLASAGYKMPLGMNLGSAMQRFATSQFDELPVFETGKMDTVIGMLRRQDVVAMYNAQLIKLRSEDNEDLLV